jgi:hypothetical protein
MSVTYYMQVVYIYIYIPVGLEILTSLLELQELLKIIFFQFTLSLSLSLSLYIYIYIYCVECYDEMLKNSVEI